jgi:hypothetical protein
MDYFSQVLSRLKNDGIKVYVVIPSYHPQFTQRLKVDYPERYQQHFEWKKLLFAMSSDSVTVLDFFENENTTKISNLYWNDGDHFTCRSAVEMLTPTF